MPHLLVLGSATSSLKRLSIKSRGNHLPVMICRNSHNLIVQQKVPINQTKDQPDFLQLKHLIECTTALIQEVDNVE